MRRPFLPTCTSPPHPEQPAKRGLQGLSFGGPLSYIDRTGNHGAAMKLSDVVWTDDDGKVIACAEKNKVLKENLAEIRQVCQDAFEDALLMGCSERQIRAVFAQLVAGLENPYRRDGAG